MAHPTSDPVPLTADRGRALLVEDSYTNQRIAMHMLERLNFDVELADNGLVALHAFGRNRHDLVLMDIMMPEMGGYDCIREIRRHFPLPRVPVIAITANVMTGDRERCLEAGADDYVSKPFKFDDLTAAVDRWRMPPPAVSSAADGAALHRDALDVTWIEQIGLLQADPHDGFSVVQLFRDEARFAIQRIVDALVANDVQQLCHAALMLNAAAANLGATALATQANEFERWGRNGDLSRATTLVDVLSAECDRVLAALEHVEQRP